MKSSVIEPTTNRSRWTSLCRYLLRPVVPISHQSLCFVGRDSQHRNPAIFTRRRRPGDLMMNPNLVVGICRMFWTSLIQTSKKYRHNPLLL